MKADQMLHLIFQAYVLNLEMCVILRGGSEAY